MNRASDMSAGIPVVDLRLAEIWDEDMERGAPRSSEGIGRASSAWAAMSSGGTVRGAFFSPERAYACVLRGPAALSSCFASPVVAGTRVLGRDAVVVSEAQGPVVLVHPGGVARGRALVTGEGVGVLMSRRVASSASVVAAGGAFAWSLEARGRCRG